jgi:hypothetical protein
MKAMKAPAACEFRNFHLSQWMHLSKWKDEYEGHRLKMTS